MTNKVIRGRGWDSENVVYTAAAFFRGPALRGEMLGFRLVCDADEQAGRGGSWKARSRATVGPWRVDEWPGEGNTRLGIRLTRAGT